MDVKEKENNMEANISESKRIIKEGYEVEKRAVKINKSMNKTKKVKLQKRIVTKFGNLDSDEMNFLKLGPTFIVLEDIDTDKVKAEFLIGLTKIRWSLLFLRPIMLAMESLPT